MQNDIFGIASIPSPYPFDLTVSKLNEAIVSKGLTLFAQIDHAAGAKEAGLQMQPALVLIFGTAKAGTPLMVAHPLLALDLPLKVLVWGEKQKIWVSYNTSEYLAGRYALSPQQMPSPEALVKLALK